MDALSLYDLNALVRHHIECGMPDEYWVQAELSDVRTNSTGHCYLEFIQKDPHSNSLVAQSTGNNLVEYLPFVETLLRGIHRTSFCIRYQSVSAGHGHLPRTVWL